MFQGNLTVEKGTVAPNEEIKVSGTGYRESPISALTIRVWNDRRIVIKMIKDAIVQADGKSFNCTLALDLPGRYNIVAYSTPDQESVIAAAGVIVK